MDKVALTGTAGWCPCKGKPQKLFEVHHGVLEFRQGTQQGQLPLVRLLVHCAGTSDQAEILTFVSTLLSEKQ